MKVYGPYKCKSMGGRSVVIVYDGAEKRSMLLARYLLEEKIGRRLVGNETVDHIDENPLNDNIENLRILSNSENVRRSAVKVRRINVPCIVCGTSVLVNPTIHNRKIRIGKTGTPTCSRRCSGLYGKSVQTGSEKHNAETLLVERYK